MKRAIVIVIAVVVALAGVAVTVAVFLRSTRPLHEIRIVVLHAASAHENEIGVLEPIEQAVGRTDALKDIRAIATESGVTVSLFFEPFASSDAEELKVDHVRAYVQSVQRRLPAGATLGGVARISPTDTYFLRKKEPTALSAPGIVDITTCGKPGPERTVVQLDLARLDAYGLDLAEVKQALDAAPARADAQEVGALLLRGAPAPIALRDVATVGADRRQPACEVVSLDGGPVLFDYVSVLKEHEAPVLQQAKVLGVTLLRDRDALRVALRFPSELSRPARLDRLVALVPGVRELEGLSLYGAVLDDDGNGELVYTTTKTAKPGAVDVLRGAIAKLEGVAWAGARGPLAKGIARVRVTVTDALTGDLPGLEKTAATAQEKVASLPGIGAALRVLPAEVARTEVQMDGAGGLTPDEIEWVSRLLRGSPDDDAKISVIAPGAFQRARYRKTPLTALARVTVRPEAPVIRHAHLERAIELEFEAGRASLTQVKKALAGIPNATAVMVDAD